jgi:hypothetical protein
MGLGNLVAERFWLVLALSLGGILLFIAFPALAVLAVIAVVAVFLISNSPRNG